MSRNGASFMMRASDIGSDVPRGVVTQDGTRLTSNDQRLRKRIDLLI